MASSGLCFGILMGCLLLFSPLLLIGCNGQPVSLIADGTGQHPPYTVTFGDGQPTADVISYLPGCVVLSGSGPWIRLEKTDGSLVLGETGAFSGLTSATVNSTAHPILDTSYTGLYHCRTVDHNSRQTYQLNIVELCPDLVSAHFNYQPIASFSRAIGTHIEIMCQGGYLPSNGLAITNSICQIGGVWYPSPPGCEKVSPTSPDTDVTATPKATSLIQPAELTATVSSASSEPRVNSNADNSTAEGLPLGTAIGIGSVCSVIGVAVSSWCISLLRRHCREKAGDASSSASAAAGSSAPAAAGSSGPDAKNSNVILIGNIRIEQSCISDSTHG
ncbi:uncharacterized protein LOC135812047 isoform X2 [Sycon ciliatum]